VASVGGRPQAAAADSALAAVVGAGYTGGAVGGRCARVTSSSVHACVLHVHACSHARACSVRLPEGGGPIADA
jgi:hypothetical protein